MCIFTLLPSYLMSPVSLEYIIVEWLGGQNVRPLPLTKLSRLSVQRFDDR